MPVMPPKGCETKTVNKSEESKKVNDTNPGTESGQLMNAYDNLEGACQGIRQEFVSSLLKWSKAFDESEKFDVFFEKRIDELIKDAQELEASLKTQKTALKGKLKCLTKTLTQVVENES